MQIRLKSYSFQLSAPYSAGTVLTAAEAQALNSLRAENISNAMRKLADRQIALLAEGQLLSDQQLAELQRQISAYDAKYQFISKHEPTSKRGALDNMIREVAQEEVLGLEIESDESEQQIESLSALPRIQAEARKRLAERQQIVGKVEELL